MPHGGPATMNPTRALMSTDRINQDLACWLDAALARIHFFEIEHNTQREQSVQISVIE